MLAKSKLQSDLKEKSQSSIKKLLDKIDEALLDNFKNNIIGAEISISEYSEFMINEVAVICKSNGWEVQTTTDKIKGKPNSIILK